jgi:hypothetical protein
VAEAIAKQRGRLRLRQVRHAGEQGRKWAGGAENRELQMSNE